MTVIADSAYLNNDPGKFKLNTYQKRDPYFGGYLLYHTPFGKLVSAYHYKNGKIAESSLPVTNQINSNPQRINANQQIRGGCYFITMPVLVGTITVGEGANATTFYDYEPQTVYLCYDGIGGGGTGTGGGDTGIPGTGDGGIENPPGFPPPNSGDNTNQQILYSLFQNYPDFETYYNTDLTDAERALTILYPLPSIVVYFNSNTASRQAENLFPGPGLKNGVGDAYRHAVWNGLNTLDIGVSLAKEFADAHENFPSNDPLEKSMDLYNNNVGRNTANYLKSIHSTVYANDILIYYKDLALNGSLIIIENNQLVPSHD